MADFIIMPKLGFDMREGVLNNWLKDVGEEVSRGEVVAEIESDKATLELESQVEGVLLHKIHEPGAIVPVGAQVGIVGAEGEDISGLLQEVEGGTDTTVESAAAIEEGVEEKPPAGKPAQAPAPATAVAEETEEEGREETGEFPDGVRATPVARRIAEEHDVDLKRVSGSGPNGRIRKADVEAYLAEPREAREAAVQQPAPAPAAAIAPTPVPSGAGAEEIPTTKLRQAIGRRMTESKTTVPHFYVTTEVDMAALLTLRKEINATLPEEEKVTVNDLILKAAALALRDFPNLNAAFAGEKIVRYQNINVGSAVAVEGGLLTVVQKNTDKSTISTIAKENKAAIGRAREGRIKPEDVEGATFTVSNLGAFDVDHFIAIINPPEAAILAVGTAQQVPVVVDGEITVGVRMKATISADHRVTDGAEAARFMQAFKAYMENPMRLLL